MDCSHRGGDGLQPQVEEFKYLSVLFTSEGKMEHEMDRQFGECCGEEGAEPEVKALVHLYSNRHLWS